VAYLGALISWGVVVYKSLGVPSLNRAYLQRALMDENVQYFALALYWFFHKPVLVTLIPFCTFSLFHSLTFVRTTLLPKVPSASPGNKPPQADKAKPQPPAGPLANVSKGIQAWVKEHFESAMLFVGFVEVIVVMGRVLIGAITFRDPLFTPLIYAHFLRLRYYLSPQTRQAFAYVSKELDKITNHPSCPAAVKEGIAIARRLITRYSESILSVQTPAGAAAPARPAQGQARQGAAANGGR